MVAGNISTGQLYSHLIPLTLLLVDGNFHPFYCFIPLLGTMFRLHRAVAFFYNLVCHVGSSPIDVTDPQWELYVVIQKKTDLQGDSQRVLIGFTAIYRFYHYPDSSRLRLGQVCFVVDIQ